MIYNKIYNPKTKRFVSVNSKTGKMILQKYLFLVGGAHAAVAPVAPQVLTLSLPSGPPGEIQFRNNFYAPQYTTAFDILENGGIDNYNTLLGYYILNVLIPEINFKNENITDLILAKTDADFIDVNVIFRTLDEDVAADITMPLLYQNNIIRDIKILAEGIRNTGSADRSKEYPDEKKDNNIIDYAIYLLIFFDGDYVEVLEKIIKVCGDKATPDIGRIDNLNLYSTDVQKRFMKEVLDRMNSLRNSIPIMNGTLQIHYDTTELSKFCKGVKGKLTMPDGR